MTNLVKLREAQGLRQEDVAKVLGVSRQAYCTYENDKRQAGYETLIKLADYFNVSVDYLLGHDCEKEMPAFQRKTEIQAYFDELSPYEQGEIIGYIKRILYNKGVNADKVKLQYC